MALLIPTLFRKMIAEIPSSLGRKMGSRILIKILLFFCWFLIVTLSKQGAQLKERLF